MKTTILALLLSTTAAFAQIQQTSKFVISQNREEGLVLNKIVAVQAGEGMMVTDPKTKKRTYHCLTVDRVSDKKVFLESNPFTKNLPTDTQIQLTYIEDGTFRISEIDLLQKIKSVGQVRVIPLKPHKNK